MGLFDLFRPKWKNGRMSMQVMNMKKIITILGILLISSSLNAIEINRSARSPLLIAVTHSELSSKAKKAQLIAGQNYIITNFRTRYLIPNTVRHATGSIEPLIVTAVTTTQLSFDARSTVYPQDVIYYELTDSTDIGGDRGRIIFRHDTLNDNSAWEDWRNIKYRRWESAPGSGKFTSWDDNGGSYVDIYMFNNSPLATGCHVNKIGRNILNGKHALSNIVFLGTARQNTIGAHGNTMTFADGAEDNEWSWGADHIVTGTGLATNTFGDCVRHLVIGDNFQDNILLSDNKFMIFGNNVHENTFANFFTNQWDMEHAIIIPSGTGNSFFDYSLLSDVSGTIGSEDQTYKVINPAGSTFESAISITTGTLDLRMSQWAGVIMLVCDEWSEIDKITTIPGFDVEIRPIGSFQCFTHTTSVADVNTDWQIVDDTRGVDWRYDPANADFFVVRKQRITNRNGTFTISRVIRSIGGTANK